MIGYGYNPCLNHKTGTYNTASRYSSMGPTSGAIGQHWWEVAIGRITELSSTSASKVPALGCNWGYHFVNNAPAQYVVLLRGQWNWLDYMSVLTRNAHGLGMNMLWLDGHVETTWTGNGGWYLCPWNP